jgi:hypothetical protein
MQSCLKNIKLEMLKGVYVPTNLHFRTIIQMKLFFFLMIPFRENVQTKVETEV